LQIALTALKELTAQAANPLDGFLARLGESMRRLPYRERAHLEIQFLTLPPKRKIFVLTMIQVQNYQRTIS